MSSTITTDSTEVKARPEGNTGFGINSAYNAGRFINKDGTVNVEKRGINVLQRNSAYHTMLALPRWKFFVSIFFFFTVINLIFATVYYYIGMDALGGIRYGTPEENFAEAFFFSTQTFTTVGYGRISPNGFLTSALAAIEALAGLLSFAVVTGLFYGRFSRPRAFLKFSENALLSPFNDITALMFRMVPYKNNQLTEVEVKITLAMKETENGKPVNRFYSLDLEYANINSLVLSWTIVHPITEKSPFYHLSYADILEAKAEIFVYVKGFDEAFSNTVVARTSYTADEIVEGAKFVMMYDADREARSTVLHIERLNAFVEAPLPATGRSAAS